MKTLTLKVPDTVTTEKEQMLKTELENYLHFLLSQDISGEKELPVRVPKFGCAKGKFRMAEDFDDPIDHFDEYMPE